MRYSIIENDPGYPNYVILAGIDIPLFVYCDGLLVERPITADEELRFVIHWVNTPDHGTLQAFTRGDVRVMHCLSESLH